MERQEKVVLTNMCMVYDAHGNVLIEKKVTPGGVGLIFPGGHVELREAFVDSVIREIYEETGLTITNPQLCGIKDWVQPDGSRYVVFLYKTNEYSGTIKSSSEGEVVWMPLEELKKKELLWHLELMINIFCTDDYSEIYFDKAGESESPVLK